ncbi:MAG: M48 family metalloprotease [Actinobacteria bacterium]|nr:M48 family metalloprotease [Actinomycetota bacterium]
MRFLIAYGIVSLLGASDDLAMALAGGVAFLPLLLSLATFLFGLPGGWGLYGELGARRPSLREKAVFEPVLAKLRRRGGRMPKAWFVIDDPVPNAQTLGRTVYVNSGMIGHPSLEAALAHECGHIETRIGDRLLALVRLEFPGLRVVRVYIDSIGWTITAKIVRVVSGGVSWELPILRSLWAAYFRRGEHAADRYAKRLGHSFELAEYLDVYERPLDGATPFRRGRSHPYAEQRIGRLLK